MGLDTSHEAWHGAYSAFMRWRQKIAEVAGLPPLMLMEGFFERGHAIYDPFVTLTEKGLKGTAETYYAGLPIKWDALKPSALHELLYHSDCDGDIPAESCAPIADALEELLPKLTEDGGGHIGMYRAKTEQFIKGLRLAAKNKEPLEFH